MSDTQYQGKKIGEKVFVCVFAAATALWAAGCGMQAKLPQEEKSDRVVVSIMYSNDLKEFEKYVEDTYPDIDLEVERNAAATLSGESARRLRKGHGSDIVPTVTPSKELGEYLLDLSAESYATKYQSAIMNTCSVDGRTRYIPLPGQYNGYIYNVTLARQAGVPEPETPQDLLRLMDSARELGVGAGEDGTMIGLYPVNLNSIASFFMASQLPDFLALSDGIIWSDEMQNHIGSFQDGMENCLDQAKAYVERGYMNAESLKLYKNNMVPVKDRLKEGTLILAYVDVQTYDEMAASPDCEYEFAMLPFLSAEGNHSWTIAAPDGFLGLNADLAEPGNEAKRDACHRVMGLLSTPEGQNAFMKDCSIGQSYLTGYSPDKDVVPDGLKDCVANGYVYNISLPPNVTNYFGELMVDVLLGQEELSEALGKVDDYYYHGDASVDYNQSLVGTIAGDMIYENYNVRREETVLGNLVADAVQELTGADIAFVNGGSIRSSLYEGDVYGSDLQAVCPYANEIVVLETDGKTIREILENGISRIYQENEIPGGRFLNVAGLKYSFIPPTADTQGELLSFTLPDGSGLEDHDIYTIAVTNYMAGSSGYLDNNGDGYTMLNIYSDTVPPAENVKLVKETKATYVDALAAYFENRKDGIIALEPEGRITVENGSR